MVCCPFGEVSDKPSCDADGDTKSTTDLLRSKATFFEFLNGKSEPVCGKRTIAYDTVRIAQGQKAAPGDWPWMVLLGYARKGATKPSFECGGTLISEKNVLTGAHCLEKR